MKICTKCKIEKELSQFSKDKLKIDGLNYWCKECAKENMKQYRIKLRKLKPWFYSYSNAKKRCNNLNHIRYHRYGGRGIKCLITLKQVEELWFRDKAYLMKKPSIDREDNDGNYKYSNCRFIELVDNIKKMHLDKDIKTASEYLPKKNK